MKYERDEDGYLIGESRKWKVVIHTTGAGYSPALYSKSRQAWLEDNDSSVTTIAAAKKVARDLMKEIGG
jgi:hypothetical protein